MGKKVKNAPTVKEEVVDKYEENNDDGDGTTDTSSFAFLWLFIFSSMMFTLPFLAFYGTKEWLQNSFQIVGFPNNCYSALAAVIVVNVIICLYAMLAFNEDCGVQRVSNKKIK